MGTAKLEHNEDSGTLLNVHDSDQCDGEFCTIHNRSDHPMRAFPQHWRSDRGIMERICPHGVGHPDPDSPWPENSYQWVHGCDGCCQGPERRDEISVHAKEYIEDHPEIFRNDAKWIIMVESKGDERREYPEFIGPYYSQQHAEKHAVIMSDDDAEYYYTVYPLVSE